MATVQGNGQYFEFGGNRVLFKDAAGREMIAPEETSSTASREYAVGEAFIYNNLLYRATAAIAQGGTITPGTNCETVPDGIGGEVGELKNAITHLNNFFDESTNLVNPATITKGMVISSSGVETSSGQTDTSDWISVTPRTRYYWKNLSYVCRYGQNKEWKGRTSGTSSDHILLGSDVYYVRVCGATGTGANWRFNQGDAVDDQPYHLEAWLNDIDISPLVNDVLDPALHKTETSTADIFENGGIALASGNNNDDSLSSRLRTILYLGKNILAVTPKAGYEMAIYAYLNGQYQGCWKGAYLLKTGTAVWFSNTITLSHIGNYQFRIVVRKSSDNTAPVSPTTDSDCLSFYAYKFATDTSTEIIDRVIFSRNINDVFSIASSPEWTGTAQTMTSAQVYALYDSLATDYPSYITKTALGNDEWGNEMAIYDAVPAQPSASFATKKPKLFINCSIHGYEHVPAITMYLLLRELCQNWASNPLLNVLRHEVELHILPVANPSGFNAYTRKNANGIDLNRNFEAGFHADDDPSATDYSGTSALNELETQYIYNWMSANKDTDIAIDFHNFGAFAGNIDWITVKNRYQSHIAGTLIQRMTQKFKSEYSWLDQSADAYYGYTSGVSSYNGLVKDQASAFGIKYSYTFELPRSFWGTITDGATTEEQASMSPTHRKICIECIVNFILINLVQLAVEYSRT